MLLNSTFLLHAEVSLLKHGHFWLWKNLTLQHGSKNLLWPRLRYSDAYRWKLAHKTSKPQTPTDSLIHF